MYLMYVPRSLNCSLATLHLARHTDALLVSANDGRKSEKETAWQSQHKPEFQSKLITSSFNSVTFNEL